MSGAGRRRERIRNTLRYYSTVAHHIEREHTDRSDRALWTRVGEAHPSADLLEVGCGTGRITTVLAPRVGRIAAVDLSPEMMRRARRKFPAGSSVALIRADVLDLPVRPGFDVAVAANGVFSHLLEDEERLRGLREMAGTLRPGGSIYVDAFWLSRDRRDACSGPEGQRRTRTMGRERDALRVAERWVCDPATARCRVHYRYRHPDGTREEAESLLRFWTEDEVRRLFPEAGLRLTATWGDYDRSAWSPRARRLVVRARRPG